MTAFSFDDGCFGLTHSGKVIDVRLAARPPGFTREQWYAFAGQLARALNERFNYGA